MRTCIQGRAIQGKAIKVKAIKAFELAPVARAIALTLAAGGMIGSAHAVQPFSPAWFANKGAIQATAAATGLMPNGTPVSSLSPQGQQQAANTQLQQSIANLGQVARGIAWLQGMQAAQRQAALGNPSSIPDGLGVGGLDTGSLAASWKNANAPTQTTDANGKTVVDIQQTADKAIANWNTFNVGKNTIVQFDQASADWAILNRITDPAMAPSTIEGQIRAPGTVLIVNQNGIVFSGTSQINTRNLVAAAANITDSQFTNNGIYGPDQSTPSFTNAQGNLIVQAGAQITTNAPSSVTQGGGYVLLMGQQVDNYGDIETPQGQIELAAGDNFVIRQGVGTGGNTFSTTRGNEIAPLLNPGSTSGQVINEVDTGLLLATEGDITLAGHDVQQNGVALATTTVNTRGTIHLLNSASDTTGSVTLGDTSVTAVAIEDDGSTALDSQRTALIDASAGLDVLRATTASGLFDNLTKLTDLEDESRIEIVSGGSVNFDGNSLTLATGGQIAVSATQRTFVADGAILDVSGQVGVNLAMSSNDVVVNVQGNELRDSPSNRDSGDLLNSNITVDRRDLIDVPAGTGGDPDERWYTADGLLEVSGYLDTQGHTIGEWAAQGGTIQLGGSEVVTQAGSQINLSGGSLNVATGYVAQTWLVGSDGQLYNANNAPSGMTFTGIYKGFEVAHTRWGADAAEFFYNPLIAPKQVLENGYTAGRDAGQLIVNAPTSIMEGDILTTVYNGPQQIQGQDSSLDGYDQSQIAVAKAGSLSFGQYGPGGLIGAGNTDIQIGNIADVTGGMADTDALPADRIGTTWLDAGRLNAEGLGELDLAGSGSVVIDAPLALANGGALNIVAPLVDIAADITARGGSVDIGNILHPAESGLGANALTDSSGFAQSTLEAGVTIDTRGLWVNALSDAGNLSGLAYLNGGSVTFDATQGVTLVAGSIIDVSSGGAILTGGKTQGGSGGNVTLIADDPIFGPSTVGSLVLDGTIRAIGVNGGGELSIGAGSVLIADTGSAAANAVVAGTVLLTPDFFKTGFSNYDINGYADVTVADGTDVNVEMPVYRLIDGAVTTATGADPTAALQAWLPPQFMEDAVNAQVIQRAGASLALRSAMPDSGGSISVGLGAAVTVDPGQSITLDGFGQITVDGLITAHGGAISILSEADGLTAGQNFDASGNLLGNSIWIGDQAVLDASAQAVTAVDQFGHAYGEVPDGGTIHLGGGHGGAGTTNGEYLSTTDFIVIRPGAILDASGASAIIDPNAGADTNAGLPGGASLGAPFMLASDGGSIALDSLSGIYLDGTLKAAAGGAGASGGSLSILLETPIYDTVNGLVHAVPVAAQVPSILTVTQDKQASGLSDDAAPGSNDPTLQFGQANVSADGIAAGGFDNVSLYARDVILFDGDVTLRAGQSITFAQGAIADSSTTGQVTIAAPYVLFGGHTGVKADNIVYPTLFSGEWAPSTQASQAVLNVDADLIDFRNDVLFGMRGDISGTGAIYDFAGFSDANFVSQGDIRFLAPQASGGVTAAMTRVASPGNFDFTAAQLYPETDVTAAIEAGSQGVATNLSDATIAIHRISDADPGVPMSVFGSLGLFATTVEQGGIVRAPLGAIFLGLVNDSDFGNQFGTSTQIDFLPGGITSVSADGLDIPYGGTTDGLTYNYAGGLPTSTQLTTGNNGVIQGIEIAGLAIDVQQGAVLDLSGGGDLAGRGFVLGRGGSVDVLTTPLINANPSNTFSAASDKVYAIVPSYGSAYAPGGEDSGAGNPDPGIGQQITIPAGVPGLPAGTYTLLPSNYALLPGAFRVELGGAASMAAAKAAPFALSNGSYLLPGYQGVANTDVRDGLATSVIVTPADTVRTYSQYDEMGYGDFLVANAAQFGNTIPVLPADAKTLLLQFTSGSSFSFDGSALFQPGQNGFGGSAMLTGSNMEVVAHGAGSTAGFNGVSLDVDDLNRIAAPRLLIGGTEVPGFDGPGSISINGTAGDIFIRSGVVLQAGEVILTATGDIDIAAGAAITTIGEAAVPFDSAYTYSASSTTLVVSNGDFEFSDAAGAGAINAGAGAQLYAGGTLAFATNGGVDIDPSASYGAQSLQLAASNINIGNTAGANAPTGIAFDQARFDQLVAGAGAPGVPGLENFILTAGNAINFYGTTGLDAGSNVNFVINTPAIHGYGAAGDTAQLSAGTLTWNASGTAGAIAANGPGTGSGTFDIDVGSLVFGTQTALDNTSHDRSVYGFDAVDITATGSITSYGKESLSVYRAASTDAGAVPGQSGVGGDLNVTTPLLTGAAGSVTAYTAGGALNIGGTAGVATPGVTGAEIDLNGDSVSISTAVVLPSGKLVVNAANDIVIGTGAQLDASGQPVAIEGQTVYGFGGDIILSSAQGNVIQQAGSTIDVSATGNDAGSLTITAVGAGGRVSLEGLLRGASTPVAGDATVHADGSISIGAQTLASGNAAGLSDDFATLNQALDDGGFFAARSFDLKQGSLVIGNELKAGDINVSVDGGSLTVDGTIDASGRAPGSIRLAARDDLELTASGMLDAHGRALRVDSYGNPIEADNRGAIELATVQGTLRLDAGSGMNVGVISPNGEVLATLGQIELDAPRGTIGSATVNGDETGGDIRIDASGTLNIVGAQSIAVNGFWTYSPTDAHGTIVQDNGEGVGGPAVSGTTGFLGMNQIDGFSQVFIGHALSNADLQGRLAGLEFYSDAFHLRPGVEIDGDVSAANPTGDLTVAGDIDLAGFRYASLNPLTQKDSSIYGSGEPGTLVIRANGNLDVVGSISDGFDVAHVPDTPDDRSWILLPGNQNASIETLLPITLNAGSSFPATAGLSLRYDIQINPGSLRANAVIPGGVTVTLASPFTVPAGTRLTGDVFNPDGTLLYSAGTVLTSGAVLSAGMALGSGSSMPGIVAITAMTWPAGANLGVFTNPVTLSASAVVPFEGIIPVGANVQLNDPSEPTRPTDAANREGTIAAIAPLLPQGDLSWSLRLVSGADLDAADTRVVQPLSALKASGVSGNLTLSDTHLGVQPGTSSQIKEYFYYFYHGTQQYITSSANAYGCTHYENTSCGVTYYTQYTPPRILGATPSVLRTGTGNLDLIAGGSFSEQSLFGVYTAGTQSPAIAADGSTAGVTAANTPFNAPRTVQADGTVLGIANIAKDSAAAAGYQAWYPEHGGDLLLSAQGDLSGNIATAISGTTSFDSDQTANWLWRQGGTATPTAWWINFGTYSRTDDSGLIGVTGFQGIGTLGGGNLTVLAGGNAGLIGSATNTGLDLAVASTGRVLSDGTIVMTGGGDLTFKAGGALNPVVSQAINGADSLGMFTDLRGDISVRAGTIGILAAGDGFGGANDPADPRGIAFQTTEFSQASSGPTITPGDGTASIATRGDLVLSGAGDAGMATPVDFSGVPFTYTDVNGQVMSQASGGESYFTLWTPTTSVALFSAGGDITPIGLTDRRQNNQSGFFPGTLTIVAATGDIRFDARLELAPSPQGQLEVLAADSIYGAGSTIAMSGADMNSLATPLKPVLASPGTDASDANPDSGFMGGSSPIQTSPIAFGPDTITSDLHAGDSRPALVYAGNDIVNLFIGDVETYQADPDLGFLPAPTTWYYGAKAFQIIAGRDIIGPSTPGGLLSPLRSNFIYNNDPDDISVIRAGRDIINYGVTVAGSGVLDVGAGRNLYQGFLGRFDSIGQLGNGLPADAPGASISVMAGIGANGPDWSNFAKLYLDPANAADPSMPLADQPGKVAKNYDGELYTWVEQGQGSQFSAWLQQNPGQANTPAGAYAFFQTLNVYQQSVFLRQIYFAELVASGREFTDPSDLRFQSYLRGRDAIAALFPSVDADGNPISYSGGITTLSGQVSYAPSTNVLDKVFNSSDQIRQFDAGIRTEAGGDIQILTPGGQTIVGVEGLTPGDTAGLLTQGAGDIDIYSEGSILLGESRIMTTFGGNIAAWSATGDINAGRGAKTTTVFTPPKLVYDDLGDVTLSPDVPSTGAGIATLDPIPEVPAGDIDLIAPLGTIDAGEAGIRVSGNINLAALQVVNAANIAVQGKSTGIPTIAAVNVGALTNASAAASQAVMAAQDVVQRDRNAARQALPSIFTVRVLGFGPDGGDDDAKDKKDETVGYDPRGAVQVLGQMDLSEQQLEKLTPTERRNLGR
jgi:filamentous hemagglutinin family protein